jgi:hypothetical protein
MTTNIKLNVTIKDLQGNTLFTITNAIPDTVLDSITIADGRYVNNKLLSIEATTDQVIANPDAE